MDARRAETDLRLIANCRRDCCRECDRVRVAIPADKRQWQSSIRALTQHETTPSKRDEIGRRARGRAEDQREIIISGNAKIRICLADDWWKGSIEDIRSVPYPVRVTIRAGIIAPKVSTIIRSTNNVPIRRRSLARNIIHIVGRGLDSVDSVAEEVVDDRSITST